MEEAEECPGMGRGPLHDADTIGRTARDDGTSGTTPVPRPQRDRDVQGA